MRQFREQSFAFQAIEVGTLPINIPNMAEHYPLVSEVVGYSLQGPEDDWFMVSELESSFANTEPDSVAEGFR